MRVLLMRTCLVDHVAPGVARATRGVLERLGVTVVEPKGQTCCGQAGWTSGHPDEAREVARHTLKQFAGDSPVVVPSGSCAAMIVHAYPELFAGEPEEAEAKRLASRTLELTQFLARNDLTPRAAADAPRSVAHHDSCHMLRLLREKEAPGEVLAEAGIERTPLPDSDVCCGFGGVFSVTYPEVSGALGEAKARSAASTGADALVGCDLSCLMHIAGRAHREGIDLTVRHISEVLDR